MAEYTGYLLFIEFLGLGLLLAYWFRHVRHHSLTEDVAAPQQKGASQSSQTPPREKFFRRLTAAQRVTTRAEIKTRVKNVPIPWGWPHYQDYRGRRMEKPSLSDSMNHLVDCLVREKQVARSPSQDPHFSNNVRALLEDRHHPVEIPNNPASALQALSAARKSTLQFRDLAIKELRRPWGW